MGFRNSSNALVTRIKGPPFAQGPGAANPFVTYFSGRSPWANRARRATPGTHRPSRLAPRDRGAAPPGPSPVFGTQTKDAPLLEDIPTLTKTNERKRGGRRKEGSGGSVES